MEMRSCDGYILTQYFPRREIRDCLRTGTRMDCVRVKPDGVCVCDVMVYILTQYCSKKGTAR